MTLTVYAFEDEYGTESSYTTRDFNTADNHARRHRLLMKAIEYEYSDTDYVKDYRTRRPEPIHGLPIAGEDTDE